MNFLLRLWAKHFPPTIAHVHQDEWNQARRERQLAPFVIDPIALVSHGIE